MSAISEKTRTQIKSYLEMYMSGAFDAHLRRRRLKFDAPETYLDLKHTQPNLKPFHAALLSEEFLAFDKFSRTFRRLLGNTLAGCAELIAHDHHPEVYRAHFIRGEVSRRATREVEIQTLCFQQAQDEGKTPPKLDEMIAAVLNKRDEGEVSLKRVQTDLYIRTNDGIEYFFEITRPTPAEAACYSLLHNILYNHVTRGVPRPQMQSYAVFAYNPYGGTRADYDWSFAKMYLPFEQATLIGDEFWRLIGGETTYVELLEIFAEVGREKRQHLIDSLRASE